MKKGCSWRYTLLGKINACFTSRGLSPGDFSFSFIKLKLLANTTKSISRWICLNIVKL